MAPAEFDYIIAGGGTAGVALASRLSTYLPSASILLLEAGPSALEHPNVTDPNKLFDLVPDGLLVDYSTVPQPHCDNRHIVNLAGRMLSGSSGGNVGVWMRTSATDYELMAERAGNARFGFGNMVRYFKRLENHWDKSADPQWYGFEGRFHTVGGRTYPLSADVKASAERMGYAYNRDGAKGDPRGLVDMTQAFRVTGEASSERQHSAKVYDLSGVGVRCEAPVAKILFDGERRVSGVQLVDGEVIRARTEVIVCCGAQRTPQVLMLSGIGPREQLEEHGIPLVFDSPEVGRNLFDHGALTTYFELKHPEQGLAFPFQGTCRPEFGQGFAWDFNIFGNIPAERLAPVLASDLPLEAQSSVSTYPHLRDKRCHYMVLPFYFPILASPRYNPEVEIGNGRHIALTALNLLPVSRGKVTLRSASPTDTPLIDPQFLSTQTDRLIMRTALRTVLTLAATPPLSTHLIGETPPVDARFPALSTESSDEEIDARIRGWMETIAHPMGTCALGKVLDDEFRVKGVTGLRVCDASVFPEPLGGMPSLTIYALGEMCAELVAGKEW